MKPLLLKKDQYIDMPIKHLKNNGLVAYTIFSSDISENYKKKIIKNLTKTNEQINRSVGSIIGMAIGDAFGAPLEFLDIQSNIDPNHNLKYDAHKTDKFIYKGKFKKYNLKLGQWTDDCSMGLCIADSLLLKKKYDGSDIRRRFWNWWNNGYNNAFRFDNGRENKHSVGLGGNIRKSLNAINSNHNVPPIFDNGSNDSGNGSIMRLCPIPIAYHGNINEALKYSELSSKTTHTGNLASECCRLMCFIIVKAINRKNNDNIQKFLNDVLTKYVKINKNIDKNILKLINANERENSKELCWNWRKKNLDFDNTLKNRGKIYNGNPVSSGYFGSYCVDALAIAFNSLYNTNNFNDAILRCVNMLGDADSTGSVTGQIAGAFYGYNSINKNFIKEVNKWDNYEIQLRGILLYYIFA